MNKKEFTKMKGANKDGSGKRIAIVTYGCPSTRFSPSTSSGSALAQDAPKAAKKGIKLYEK